MRFEPGTDFLESFLFSKIYFGKFQRIGFPQIKNFDFDFLNICINCLFLIIFRAIILCKKSIKKNDDSKQHFASLSSAGNGLKRQLCLGWNHFWTKLGLLPRLERRTSAGIFPKLRPRIKRKINLLICLFNSWR